MAEARARQDRLTKPQGSLGRLEELSILLAGITGNALPSIRDKVVVVMAGDHGVVAEGVSAYPQEVTPQMVLNLLHGGAAINVLAAHAGARVVVVDVGVRAEFEESPGLLRAKVAPGTRNMTVGAALTRREAEQAIEVGIRVIDRERELGLDIVGTGDMGIGNTTPSTAILAALTGLSVESLTGRGTGLDDEHLRRKIVVIERSLEVNRPDPSDPLDVLSKVGGLEIAGIAGVMLGAAAHCIPVMIDGFISTAGALIAAGLAPQVKGYLIAAHNSVEIGHRAMLDHLGLQPLLDLNMRLGEGTGAALAMSIAEASCKVLSQMATFGEAGVSEKEN
jgi:nicotinate-nucleotide--dimethylbenzimidazole phosphoribosyltransferase